MTDSTVSGNQARGGTGQGGGLFLSENTNSTVTISAGSEISGNTADSRGGGIHIAGGAALNTNISNSTISNNTSSGANGGSAAGGGIFLEGGNLTVILSRFFNNSASTGSGLFRASTAGTVTAENNWWGCDALPGSGAGPDVNGCDTVNGTADVDPRLDLVVTAASPTINQGGTSSVTADFSKNSAGLAVSPVVLNGRPIAFGETYGNMDPTSAPLTGFMATSVYTNESCPSTPPEMVMATLDNGTDAADVIITCLTTTTTTTSTTTTTTEPPPTTTTSTTTTTTEPPPTTSTTTTTTMPPPVTCNGFGPTTGCTVNGVRNQVCRGTLGTDTITGTNGADVIVGLGGNDTINGGNNDDRICGGDGTDTLNGNNGIDRLFGQNDNDALNGNNGNDALDGGPQTDTCNGGNGSDTAASCEILSGVP